MKKIKFLFLGLILVLSTLLFSNYYFNHKRETILEGDIFFLVEQIHEENVVQICESDEKINMVMRNGKKAVVNKGTQDFSTIARNYGITLEEIRRISVIRWEDEMISSEEIILYVALAGISIFIVLVFFLNPNISSLRRFQQSTIQRIPPDKALIFKNIGGLGEVKYELAEIVAFLKDPGKFKEWGAVIPKGVLLAGDPGNGKNMLAQAVAGEANVPFFSITASAFVEAFVGIGASRVRKLFSLARKSAPCVIFIDEIDAIGRTRCAGQVTSGVGETEQTLNQLLTELDGLLSNGDVVVIAATNRIDILDPALVRSKRFDLVINIQSPKKEERLEILKIHADNKQAALQGLSMEDIASLTVGFSGADLANLLNRVVIRSITSGVKIDMEMTRVMIDRMEDIKKMVGCN